MGRSGRSRGKEARPPEIIPDSGEGRAIGLSDRTAGVPSTIQGGTPHISNPTTVRQHVPIPEPKPEFRGVMAHGVAPEKHTAHERADAMRGPNSVKPLVPHYHEFPDPVIPVPVYVVEQKAGSRSRRRSSHRKYTVPAAGTTPIRLVGYNSARVNVQLLNEDSTHNIRFSDDITNLSATGQGTVLPATTSSYLTIQTQDELYAVSDDSSTPFISIIETFDYADGEVQ